MFRIAFKPLSILVSGIETASLIACGGGGGGSSSSDDSDSAYKDPVVILDSNILEFGFSAFAVGDLNLDGFDDFVGKRDTGLESGPAAEILIMLNDGKAA